MDDFLQMKISENSELYSYIIKSAGVLWQHLALRLELRDKILDIKMKSSADSQTTTEFAMTQLMNEWERRKSNEATIGAFLNALDSIHETDLCENIIKKFSQDNIAETKQTPDSILNV